MKRREFVQSAVALTASATGAISYAQSGAQPVDKRSIITSTAQFDPARPEIARLVSQACKAIGWEFEANPIDYNQGIQKVIMQQDYEAFLVNLAGSSIRIDPNFFINGVHHSEQHKKGGFNWMGYRSARLDALASGQASAMDISERKRLVAEAQEVIYADQPGTVVAYPQITMAHRSDKVTGLVPMLGEGIGSFWSDVSMQVAGDGYSRTGMNVDIKHLNPLAANDVLEFKELSKLYDTLFRIAPDGKPVPWAASGMKVLSNTALEIAIRPGMRWHDGKPFTADDVKFSLDYQTKWKAPFFLSALKTIEATEVTGPDTVRITLTKPSAPFVSAVLAAMYIIPKHIWQDIPEKANIDDPLKFQNDKPVGSGPFRFDHWRRGSELKVSANPEHFNRPKCAGIIRVVYGSHDAIAAAIERGECDRAGYILSPALVDRLKQVKNVVARGYPSHGIYHLSYNNTIKPFSDPAFRRALNLVIPRKLISELVLLGYADPGGSIISPANAFGNNPAVKAPAEDVKAARDVLAKAGYSWNAQGTLLYPRA